MGMKYSSYRPSNRLSAEERRRIHPIWRGIGFGMMVLFPIISYAGMTVMMKQPWFPLPVDLIAKRTDLVYQLIPDPLIYIKAVVFLSILLVLFAVFTLISFVVNSAFGITEKRDPFYVPPVQRRSRRR